MARDKIKQDEIERLLEALKKTLVDSISFPEKGKSEEFEVKAVSTNEVFTIRIYRGKVNREKYNLGAIIQKHGLPILELHIGPGNRHTNPDGTIIEGSHWHIYSEQYGRTQAFPADDIESDRFVDNTIAFLEKFNVIEKPEVYFQLETL